ncbi:MAG: peptidylprolyl isomerase [Anaerotignum sp.]|nr:peptidylprolyl isomerase [Anaerotignum sp.]MBQ3567324.1 peptidylprolyl isomerase [Anaerotignum sp.]
MKKRYMVLALAAVMAFGIAGCGNDTAADTNNEQATTATVDTKTIIQAQMPADGEEIAVITTSEGVVKMRFFPEEAPKAVENFKTLAKDGYYDGLIFHRVIEDFMVQTGDPEGTGFGGESCWGEDFETEVSERLHFYRGAVAMANAGLDTNGSQFFIVQQKTVMEEALKAITDARDNNKEEVGVTLTDGIYYTLSQLYPDEVLNYYRAQGGSAHLEYVFGNGYSIFGQVFEGLETVDTIAAAETDEMDKPVNDIIIESIVFENYTAQ